MGDSPPNMRMQVNQSRRNDQTIRLEHIPRADIADGTLQTRNCAVRNADIQHRIDALRRINHRPAFDDNVVLHALLPVELMVVNRTLIVEVPDDATACRASRFAVRECQIAVHQDEVHAG